ncbi:MAG TPA: hypothetical protein VMW50_03095 [Dehalococcoidia bacterium]|nr:hypothetical protein [Dehalococcoidia bacterium]
MPWDETDDYIRSGHGSTDCDRMRTKTLSAAQGIKAIICFKGDKSSIQSYLFAKDKGWTMSKAKTWFKAHSENVEEQIKWMDLKSEPRQKEVFIGFHTR